MSLDDRYPASSGRRRFVKGVLGSSALAGVGAAGSATVSLSTQPEGIAGGSTTFYGARNTEGPAPRAMPQIPVTLDDDGYLRGVWPPVVEKEKNNETYLTNEMELGGVTYSARWFQYCGIESAPGIQPNADQDEYFRYKAGGYDWQSGRDGAKLHVDDFSDYETWGNDVGRDGLGKPAKATWRSQGVDNGTIPVQVIRSPNVEAAAASGERDWLSASTTEGFIAVLAKCTHFCCVPGYKSTQQAAKFDAADEIYCPCHQSVYDPFDVVKRSFVARPRVD